MYRPMYIKFSIATHYGLDGPGIKSWGGGGRFSIPFHPDPRVPVQWVLGHSPPPSSNDVKERVMLYLYSSSVPLRHAIE